MEPDRDMHGLPDEPPSSSPVARGGRLATFLALVVGALAVVGLLWKAGEAHYRSCLEEATITSGLSVGGGFVSPTQETQRRIEACDRLPF